MNTNDKNEKDLRSKSKKKSKNERKGITNSNSYVILNPDEPSQYLGNSVVGEEAVADTVIQERVLSVQERRKRAIAMRRIKFKLQRARQISRKRFAKQENLQRRAEKLARKILRKRFMGDRGEKYVTLSPQEKVTIDKALEKRITPAIVKKLAQRLLPKVRQAEAARLKKYQENQAKLKEQIEYIESNLISEKVSDALIRKSEQSGFSYDILKTVYIRGLLESSHKPREVNAFDRLNSFISGGKARKLDSDLLDSNKPSNREIGTDSLVKIYRKNVPGQNQTPVKEQTNPLKVLEKRKNMSVKHQEQIRDKQRKHQLAIAKLRRKHDEEKRKI